ncbi:MAG: outer membrane protein assembly factor [Candidatus Saccharibacteria bacterium]|nr:outer membrane protein assembly factor [Moraxellaceae bacterium]
MLNSRFSPSLCVLLGVSLTAQSFAAEANAPEPASQSASGSTVVNPVATKDIVIPSESKKVDVALDATNETSALPVNLMKPTKPSVFTRISRAVFFWRKPSPSEDSIPAEPTISVEIKGAPEVLATNLSETLKQVQVVEFEDFQSALPRLRSLATDAAQAVGYYTANFRFSKTDNRHLVVNVVPDTPVIVKSQNILITGEGETDKAYLRLQKSPDLVVGDPFNHGEYEKTKSKIQNLATERGYFKGRYITHDVQVTLPPKTADIILAYETGVRYAFGDVTYKSSNPNKKLPLKPSVLATMQPFKAGDPYQASDLAKLSRNLIDTRYFNNVQVDAPTPEAPSEDTLSGSEAKSTPAAGVNSLESSKPLTSADHPTIITPENKTKPSIPVVVILNADNPNSAEAGVGYGTDTGPRIRTQYRRALVNDSGHSFDANLELSQINHSLDLRYNIPMGNPLTDVVSIFGGYEDEVLNESNGLKVNTKTTTVGIQRTINPAGEWQRAYSLRYRGDVLENNAINVNPILLPPPFNVAGISSNQQALLAGFGLNQLISRGGANPTTGYRQFYQIDVASRSAFSDANMVILRAGIRALQTFADKHQVVISADVGTIITTDFNRVPYNLRFFAGGDQSIRGYDYKSLSSLVNGYEIGGQNLAVGSLEYNYLFKPKLRGAVFIDAGNAFDAKFNDPVKFGAGFGVRWASPVGPVRIDLAAGVSEKSPPIRLVFYIGAPL